MGGGSSRPRNGDMSDDRSVGTHKSSSTRRGKRESKRRSSRRKKGQPQQPARSDDYDPSEGSYHSPLEPPPPPPKYTPPPTQQNVQVEGAALMNFAAQEGWTTKPKQEETVTTLGDSASQNPASDDGDESAMWEVIQERPEGYCVQFAPSIVPSSDGDGSVKPSPCKSDSTEESSRFVSLDKSGKSTNTESTYQSAETNLVYYNASTSLAESGGASTRFTTDETMDTALESHADENRGSSSQQPKKMGSLRRLFSSTRSFFSRSKGKGLGAGDERSRGSRSSRGMRERRAKSEPNMRSKDADNWSTSGKSERTQKKGFGLFGRSNSAKSRSSHSKRSNRSLNGKKSGGRMKSDDQNVDACVPSSSWNDVPDAHEVQATFIGTHAVQVAHQPPPDAAPPYSPTLINPA